MRVLSTFAITAVILPLLAGCVTLPTATATGASTDGDCHAMTRANRTAVATYYFDTGQSTVNAAYDQDLRRLAHDAKYEIKVCVIGQADQQGNADFNRRLSLKRAQAVADVLAHYGVPRSVLVAVAVGEAFGHMGGTRKEGQDRRVEVYFPREYE